MSTSGKWLLGCGIGCGIVVLLIAAIGVGSFFLIRKTVDGFEEIERVSDDLTERYGRIPEFRPEAGGGIPAGRLESFLAIRERMLPAREEMERKLRDLARAEKDGVIFSPFRAIGLIRTGIGLIPDMMEFARKRNEALLAEEMGLGEHLYIYAVAYYGLLGKSPEDGPPFRLISHEHGREEDEDLTVEEVREQRGREIRGLVNRHLLSMLSNQMEDLERGSGFTRDADWRRRLSLEIAAMESDSLRLPWQDGLPPELESSLRPYREALEQSYSPMLSSMEISIVTQ